MARIVNDDVFLTAPEKRGSAEKYPYDEWLDGKTRVFVRGEDFDKDIQVLSFIVAVKKGMRKRGFEIYARTLNDDEVALKVLIGK